MRPFASETIFVMLWSLPEYGSAIVREKPRYMTPATKGSTRIGAVSPATSTMSQP